MCKKIRIILDILLSIPKLIVCIMLYRRLTMETLKENIITVEDIKEEIEKAKLEVPREDEDFDDRYDRLHAEWEVKGLKKYRKEINDAFTNKETFKNWVIDIWGDIDTYIAVINEELKLREIEITREASECAALMKDFFAAKRR